MQSKYIQDVIGQPHISARTAPNPASADPGVRQTGADRPNGAWNSHKRHDVDPLPGLIGIEQGYLFNYSILFVKNKEKIHRRLILDVV